MVESGMKKLGVLVLDGMWNKTLSAVRSLGQKGIKVAVGEATRLTTSHFSRYASRRLVYPSPTARPDAFMDWLLAELKAGSYEMVLPTEFSTQQLIARNVKHISSLTGFPFPPYELAQKVHDKAWLMKFAVQKGYPAPKTFFVEDIEELEGIANRVSYPAVIKPKESSGSRGIMYVKDRGSFRDNYLSVHSKYPYPLVQEYIPASEGGGCGVAALFNMKGEPRAGFVYKRLREYPVSGGPSTLRESIRDERLKGTAFSILKDLNWVGPAMVEFRKDPRDNTYKLLEINPRLWGSLSLSVLSGVDFPFLLYMLAKTGDCEEVIEYRAGVRCRWLIPGDIMHLMANKDKGKALRNFFERADGYDILSLHDPLPVVGRLSSLIPFLFNREMRKLVFR